MQESGCHMRAARTLCKLLLCCGHYVRGAFLRRGKGLLNCLGLYVTGLPIPAWLQ